MAEKSKRVGPVTFTRQVRAEGSKVTWTTRTETVQATIMVMVMSILVALFLFSADTLIGIIVRFVTGLGS